MVESLARLAELFDADTDLTGLVVDDAVLVEAGYDPDDSFGNAWLELPNGAWVDVNFANEVVDYGC